VAGEYLAARRNALVAIDSSKTRRKSMDAVFGAFMQATTFLFWIMDALLLTFLIYKFVRRVRRKVREPSWSLLSQKVFGMWTWMIFMPLMLAAYAIALMLFFLTRSIEASLGAFALVAGIAVFVWLIWAIVPALEEMIRESLES